MAIKSLLSPIKIGLVASAIVLMARFLGLLQFWEWAAYDQLFLAKPDDPVDSRIVLVAVSESDVQRAGTYPFSDRLWAEFLRKLRSEQPRVIGLDIFRDQPVPPGQKELKEVFEVTPNLIGITKLPPGRVPPPPILEQKNQFGDVSGIPDRDGVNRRTFLYPISELKNSDSEIPHFALKLAYFYLKQEGIEDKNSAFNPNWLQLGQARFRDRLVIVGVGGESFNDIHESPFTAASDKTVRGIDLHAQVASQIISTAKGERGLIQVWPDWLESLWVVFWAVGSAVVFWYTPFKKLLLNAFIVALSLSTLVILICYTAFLSAWWLPSIPTILVIWITVIQANHELFSKKLKIANQKLIKAKKELSEFNTSLEKLVRQRTKELESAHQQILKTEKLHLIQKILEILGDEITYPTINLDIILNSIQQLISDLENTHLGQNKDLIWLLKELENRIQKSINYFEKIVYILGRYPYLEDKIPFELVKADKLEDFLSSSVQKILDIANKKYQWLKDDCLVIYSCRINFQLHIDFNNRRYLICLLSYLIENSLDAIDRKNTLLSQIFKPELKIWLYEEKDWLIITVEDNGIGIQNKELRQIFEPFVSFTGRLGLGLYQSQQIVNKFGGNIEIFSEKEKFTKIIVKIKLKTLGEIFS